MTEFEEVLTKVYEHLDGLAGVEEDEDMLTCMERAFYRVERDEESEYLVGFAESELQRYGLMVKDEIRDYVLAKSLERVFERCSEELDNKRLAILERLRPRLENLTKFEHLMLDLYAVYHSDERVKKMLEIDEVNKMLESVRTLYY